MPAIKVISQWKFIFVETIQIGKIYRHKNELHCTVRQMNRWEVLFDIVYNFSDHIQMYLRSFYIDFASNGYAYM